METTVGDTSRDCIIFDIDGTIADNTHRHHFLQKSPKDWDGFNAAMGADKLHLAMAQLVNILGNHYPILLCTGRQECDRLVTMDWLEKHNINWCELHMRPTGDFRPDDVVKRELLETILACGWRPLFVVDDRKSVVAMWRQAGLVCLQCAEGDF